MEYPAALLIAHTLSVFACGAAAGEVPSYTIPRAGTPVEVDGRLNELAWMAAPAVGEFQFPWWKKGKKEQTVAKLLWDDKYIYVAYICQDAHIWAEHTERDSAVYLDDCVELFTAPHPDRPQDYFNIEMNVKAAFLDQHHPNGPDDPNFKEWNGEGIRIKTTVAGTLNDDSDTDHYWILEAAIPLANFARVAKHAVPKPGDVWRLNLNRLGGKTNPQFSQWSPGKSEKPQFHAPRYFGRVTFSAKTVPF